MIGIERDYKTEEGAEFSAESVNSALENVHGVGKDEEYNFALLMQEADMNLKQVIERA